MEETKMKKKLLYERIDFLIKILLLIGGEFLCYFFSPRGHAVLTILSLLIVFAVWCYFLWYLNIWKKFKANTFWGIIIALSASAVTIQENYAYFANNRKEQIEYVAAFFGKYAVQIEKTLIIGLMGCAVLAGGVLLLLFWKRFIAFIKEFLKECDRIDLRYMFIAGIAVAFLIVVLYNLTTIFYYTGINYDVIYTTDTGALSMGDVWMHVNHGENDVRQPLYALGSIPFASVVAIIGKIFFLLPNTYIILLAIVQGWLLILSNAMLAKILRISGQVKIIFYLVSFFSYSNLLFTLNLEQYVFAVFYLIAFIYFALNRKEEKVNACMYAFCTGSILTSGIICLLKAKYFGWKDMVKTIFMRGFAFVGILAMFGRWPVIFNTARFTSLLRFTSYNKKAVFSMAEKLMQYLNFVRSIYIKPQIQIVEDMYYQMAEINVISVLGFILIVLAVLGFILTFRERLSQVSAVWIAFSFAIMVIAGWGVNENGMILYSLYFGWAFTILLIQLFQWMYKRWKKVSIIIGYGVSIILMVVNCVGMLELTRFGMSRYF